MLRAPGAKQGRDDNHAFPAQLSEGFSPPHNLFCFLFQDIWEHKPLCLLAPLIAKGKKRRQEEELASEYNFATEWKLLMLELPPSGPSAAPPSLCHRHYRHHHTQAMIFFITITVKVSIIITAPTRWLTQPGSWEARIQTVSMRTRAVHYLQQARRGSNDSVHPQRNGSRRYGTHIQWNITQS